MSKEIKNEEMVVEEAVELAEAIEVEPTELEVVTEVDLEEEPIVEDKSGIGLGTIAILGLAAYGGVKLGKAAYKGAKKLGTFVKGKLKKEEAEVETEDDVCFECDGNCKECNEDCGTVEENVMEKPEE